MTSPVTTSRKTQSAAAKGTYYKRRSKDWAESKGYVVAYLEQLRWIFKPGIDPKTGHPYRPFAVKKDQMAADLLVMNARHAALVQVKFGRDHVADAVQQFRQFVCPPSVEQWVWVWESGGRYPEVIDAKTYVIRGEEVDIPFAPVKKAGGLF